MTAKEIINRLREEEEITDLALEEFGLIEQVADPYAVYINYNRIIVYTKCEYYQRLGIINFITNSGKQIPIFVDDIESLD